MFVFRNNTVERFFPQDFTFSGYDDVSFIPEADGYVWFYQAPIKFDNGLLAEEIDAYLQKFRFAMDEIDSNKTVIAFTMNLIYAIPVTIGDFRLKEAVAQYNAGLMAAAEEHSNLKVLDIAEFTRQYPLNELIDWKFYFLSQMGLNPRLSNDFKTWFARKLDQIALS